MSESLIKCEKPNNGKPPCARGDVFVVNEVPYVVLKIQKYLDDEDTLILIAGKLSISSEELFSLHLNDPLRIT